MYRAILVLLVAAPLAAAPVPKGAASKLYFPTAVGAKWVYVRGDDEEAVEVSEVEKTDGEWVVSRKRSDGTAQEYLTMTVSAAGLTQPKTTSGNPGPVILLKAKATAGDTWDVPDGKRTFIGAEDVTVAAGTFPTLKVAFDPSGGGDRITLWYAPGIGEVKRTRTAAGGGETVVRSLKSFTPAK